MTRGGGADDPLRGQRVLVVEDEYLIATDIAEALAELGATVVGPVGSVKEALRRIEAEGELDGAVLDINLGQEKVFPVADALIARHVPFVFATGYSNAAVPDRYTRIPRCEKPVQIRTVANLLKEQMIS
jgi:CheY-like chemotaxis protein